MAPKESLHRRLTVSVRAGALEVIRGGVRGMLKGKLKAAGLKPDGKLIEALLEHSFSKSTDKFVWPRAPPALVEFLDGLELTEHDLADLEHDQAEFRAEITVIVEKTIKNGAKFLFGALWSKWPEMRDYNTAVEAGFEQRLEERWGEAFDALRMMRHLAVEHAAVAHKRLNRSRAKHRPIAPHLLLRLHIRACQVVGEILILMKAGYADGASARWRTLHEITVVARAISDGGEELAKRYADHEDISHYKAGLLHQSNCAARGERPFSMRDMARSKARYDAAVARYGKAFKSEYGWAADYLGNSDPKFSQLEDKAGKADVRPEYKLASYNVHAGSRGLFFKLGSLDGSTLLAGPTNAGFEEPGIVTANALLQITALILPSPMRLDDVVALGTLAKTRDHACRAFMKAARKLRLDHAANQSKQAAKTPGPRPV